MQLNRLGLAFAMMAGAFGFACRPGAAGVQVPDLALGSGDIPEKFERTTAAFDHTRRDVMIPMRDGVKLFTVLLIPHTATGQMPIVLTRTPYDAEDYATPDQGASPRMAMNAYSDYEPLVRGGYILAFQDIRGKHRSEGRYVVNLPPRGPLNAGPVDHTTDAWDTIDWLVKDIPGNNGRVGLTGVSYDGFLALLALLDPHPALKAVVPIDAMVDTWLGDDWYHNGALRQTMVAWHYKYSSTRDDSLDLPYGYRDLFTAFLDAGSASAFSRRVGADRLPAWRRVIDNPAYTAIWQQQAVQRLLDNAPASVPTLTAHGLFDQEDMFGAIAAYATLEKRDPRNDSNFLVIGPWYHGQAADPDGSAIGNIRWDSNTSRYFRERVRQPFWDRYLKDKPPARPLAPVLAFETGTNEWRQFDTWPPLPASASQRLYLRQGERLAFEPPAADEGQTQYVADPAKPVPFQSRPVLNDYAVWERWLVEDQRPLAAQRPDVAIFVSSPLEVPVTVRGQPVAHLVASTSGTDTDWVVKLIDVFPEEYPRQPELGGYQLMISADILRGRYRESFEVPAPIASGKALPYRIVLPHANHTFLPGHRIMVQIQSSWFPLYDRNPQKFVTNIAYAGPESFVRATQRIYHAANAPSFIELPVDRETTHEIVPARAGLRRVCRSDAGRCAQSLSVGRHGRDQRCCQ